MSIWTVLTVVAAAWALIHILDYVLRRRNDVLARSRPLFHPGSSWQHTQVLLNGIKLQVSTTRWNIHHDRLSSCLARGRKRRIATVVRAVYDLGVVMGALGMAVASFFVLWKCGEALGVLLHNVRSSSVHTPTLYRRSVVFTEEDQVYKRSMTDITPIIPGVTVPLSHLPIIFMAVFISQAVHELGHALAATLEFLPMTACGASLIACIPSAFVLFPTAGMNGLNPRARARITAAGPFHNFVFWLCFVFATRVGIVNILGLLSGYYDISDVGKAVVDVDLESPLSLHLQPGSIISKVDDISLAFSIDKWTEVLQGKIKSTTLGWCVPEAHLDSCCDGAPKHSPLVCFVTQDNLSQGCIDPVPVMTSSVERCDPLGGCPGGSLCVLPRMNTQLLRLTVAPSIEHLEEQSVILWSGSPMEVWEEVQVSSWVPRIPILPLWLPPLLATCFEYLAMAALSLYLFNLLPLPHLDGTALLDALLDCALLSDHGSVSFDFSALEAGSGGGEPQVRRRWKGRIMRYSPYTLLAIVVCYVAISLINFILY